MQIKLYELRKNAGLNQVDLAKKLGISANQYGKKERGQQEFTQDEMFLLSNFFEKPIGDIFLPRKSPKRKHRI
ncbi:helix-turn-helix transcriptional regulator [Streptococcus anginosus]|uniref:helix-turn-helix transcriptional regulator n=1 Tax=Streptococcus anginosus TaxID=1328 RepID=UPI0021F90511|nr:helix-turn-helix transcriptional regulator [Streptococcus anginosus]MCW0993111.1 helix-turn-helix transcriptional regulator [Streptococcus anginosus]